MGFRGLLTDKIDPLDISLGFPWRIHHNKWKLGQQIPVLVLILWLFSASFLKTASEMHVAPWISYTVYKSTSGLVVPQTPRDHQRMLLNAKMLLYIQA